MEITNSKVSVYEVELDISPWPLVQTTEIPDFDARLLAALPGLMEHKCVSGERGGFLAEVRKGTHFAHVIEHVLLELIRLTVSSGERYSGWTRKTGEGRYVVHYGAPDFLTGRLAALLAVEMVKRWVAGEEVAAAVYIEDMKDPLGWFERSGPGHDARSFDEPMSLIHEIEMDAIPGESSVESLDPELALTIAGLLQREARSFHHILELWRRAFYEYGGNFGRAVLDKIEVLAPHHHLETLAAGHLLDYLKGVQNLSRLMKSYSIPVNFVIHAIWTYRNYIQLLALDVYADEAEELHRVTGSFDRFFGLVLHGVWSGFALPGRTDISGEPSVLRAFRELDLRREHVLIIDGDELSRKAARSILENNGYRVIEAMDGSAGYEIIAGRPADIAVVVVDAATPGLHEGDICTRIKEPFPHLRIVATGHAMPAATNTCLLRHDIRFISKPFKQEELLREVERLWSGARKPEGCLKHPC